MYEFLMEIIRNLRCQAVCPPSFRIFQAKKRGFLLRIGFACRQSSIAVIKKCCKKAQDRKTKNSRHSEHHKAPAESGQQTFYTVLISSFDCQ